MELYTINSKYPYLCFLFNAVKHTGSQALHNSSIAQCRDTEAAINQLANRYVRYLINCEDLKPYSCKEKTMLPHSPQVSQSMKK